MNFLFKTRTKTKYKGNFNKNILFSKINQIRYSELEKEEDDATTQKI